MSEDKLYTLKQLESMHTLLEGHTGDLKVEDESMRVWLSRLTVSDGAPYNNQVTVEIFVEGDWKIVKEYEAK